MNNDKYPFYWRISDTAALLDNRHFFALGLPPVNLSDYKTFTSELPRSTGAIARQGYINISLLWDEMDYAQLRTLTKIVTAAVTAGTIYATVDRAFGTKLLNDFVDISGVPHPLTFNQMNNSRGVIIQNVQLVITNITVTADPSSVL